MRGFFKSSAGLVALLVVGLVIAAGGAATGFNGNQGSAAVVSGTHKAVFMGFPYEAIPAAGRGPVMATTLGWCNQ